MTGMRFSDDDKIRWPFCFLMLHATINHQNTNIKNFLQELWIYLHIVDNVNIHNAQNARLDADVCGISWCIQSSLRFWGPGVSLLLLTISDARFSSLATAVSYFGIWDMFIPSHNTHGNIERLLMVKLFRHSPRMSSVFPKGHTSIVLLTIYLHLIRSQGWVAVALHYLLPLEFSWDEIVIQHVHISWKPKRLIEMGESDRLIRVQLTKCKS